MSIRLLILMGPMVLLPVCGALATDRVERPTANSGTSVTPSSAAKTRKVSRVEDEMLLTGSHIKRDVRRYGQITDGPSLVLVIDRKAIERSGASDLRQLLSRSGVR
jgi:outer membrane cobalamin receptor